MRQALRRLQQQQAPGPQCLLAWLLVARLLVLAAARVQLLVLVAQWAQKQLYPSLAQRKQTQVRLCIRQQRLQQQKSLRLQPPQQQLMVQEPHQQQQGLWTLRNWRAFRQRTPSCGKRLQRRVRRGMLPSCYAVSITSRCFRTAMCLVS
jgi:hypothetical protein